MTFDEANNIIGHNYTDMSKRAKAMEAFGLERTYKGICCRCKNCTVCHLVDGYGAILKCNFFDKGEVDEDGWIKVN